MIATMPLFALLIAVILGEPDPTGAGLGVVVSAIGVVIFLVVRLTDGPCLFGNALRIGAAIALAGCRCERTMSSTSFA